MRAAACTVPLVWACTGTGVLLAQGSVGGKKFGNPPSPLASGTIRHGERLAFQTLDMFDRVNRPAYRFPAVNWNRPPHHGFISRATNVFERALQLIIYLHMDLATVTCVLEVNSNGHSSQNCRHIGAM